MRRPWHLWAVGIVTLVWNAMGAVDYLMTQFRVEAYLAQFTPEQLAFFESFPAWVTATWALAVWLAVAGSLSLLWRHRTAPVFFGLALLFMLATAVHNFGLSDVRMDEVAGPEALWFTLAIFVVTLASWLYARAMRQRGVLR